MEAVGASLVPAVPRGHGRAPERPLRGPVEGEEPDERRRDGTWEAQRRVWGETHNSESTIRTT